MTVMTAYDSNASGGNIRKNWLITVDVNGPKKGPNQNGRDTFFFCITGVNTTYNGPVFTLTPRPSSSGDGLAIDYCGSWINGRQYYETNNIGSCSSKLESSWGKSCADRIIRSGWKMDY